VNIFKRLGRRIRDEGLGRTIKYAGLVSYDTAKEFVLETLLDLKYSRRLLWGNQKTAYKHLGANDVWHTDYSAMPLIFDQIEITPADVLVDVGCGKGRVINYWLSRGYTNKIYGLELDPHVAFDTALQFADQSNIIILSGDAVLNLPGEGTIFYFYNPFEPDKVASFEMRIAEIARTHHVTIAYYNPKSIHIFENGKWAIRFINFEENLGIESWGRLNKYHDLAIIKSRS